MCGAAIQFWGNLPKPLSHFVGVGCQWSREDRLSFRFIPMEVDEFQQLDDLTGHQSVTEIVRIPPAPHSGMSRAVLLRVLKKTFLLPVMRCGRKLNKQNQARKPQVSNRNEICGFLLSPICWEIWKSMPNLRERGRFLREWQFHARKIMV